MRVLFDTNVVVYMITADAAFKASLGKRMGELRSKKAVKLISTITVQEIEVWARHTDDLEVVRSFLENQFASPLILDKSSAQDAARLASQVTRPKGATQAEGRAITDRWHRDAAIAGIAHRYGLDALLTANRKDFEPFVEHMSCELMVLTEA